MIKTVSNERKTEYYFTAQELPALLGIAEPIKYCAMNADGSLYVITECVADVEVIPTPQNDE